MDSSDSPVESDRLNKRCFPTPGPAPSWWHDAVDGLNKGQVNIWNLRMEASNKNTHIHIYLYLYLYLYLFYKSCTLYNYIYMQCYIYIHVCIQNGKVTEISQLFWYDPVALHGHAAVLFGELAAANSYDSMMGLSEWDILALWQTPEFLGYYFCYLMLWNCG